MRTLITVLTITTLSLGAIEAHAKGGNDGRNDVKAELAEARKKNNNSSTGGSFFSNLFGGDETKPTDKTAKSKK